MLPGHFTPLNTITWKSKCNWPMSVLKSGTNRTLWHQGRCLWGLHSGILLIVRTWTKYKERMKTIHLPTLCISETTPPPHTQNIQQFSQEKPKPSRKSWTQWSAIMILSTATGSHEYSKDREGTKELLDEHSKRDFHSVQWVRSPQALCKRRAGTSF